MDYRCTVRTYRELCCVCKICISITIKIRFFASPIATAKSALFLKMTNIFLVLLITVVSGVLGVTTSSNKSQCVCTATLDGRLPAFTPTNFHFSGNVRRYYIAAEEMEWDYAPTGWDNWLGVCEYHLFWIQCSRIDIKSTGSP
jgi:hypothetical protein